jgi:hypothetical protein
MGKSHRLLLLLLVPIASPNGEGTITETDTAIIVEFAGKEGTACPAEEAVAGGRIGAGKPRWPTPLELEDERQRARRDERRSAAEAERRANREMQRRARSLANEEQHP